MQRRGGSGQPVKGQSANRPKARKAPTTQVSSAADLQEQLDRRTRERDEALEQLAATSEVLKVISSLPGDLQPVFDAILANATDLCGARFASLRLSEGDQFRTVSLYNAPAALVEHWRNTPLVRPHPKSALGRTGLTKEVVQIDDVRKGAAYNKRDPLVVAGADLGGYRTVLTVPMLKEDVLIGVISIYRQEVKAFTDEQIELVKNFAAQAVIAIENTRLLSELRESLQQQTATADVLKVISSSPGHLEPVFNAMLEKATHICEAKFGLLLRFDGEMFRFAAEIGTPPALAQFVRGRGPFQPVAGSHLERVMRTKKVSHTVDYAAEGIRSPPVTLGGARSTVDVPLLKDNELIGVFSIYRQEVRPFTDKQIELVKNFAAQAVIAIENARLLNELRQRTDDLSEALEQQTATSEVLKVISSSPGELEPVFNAMLANATRICQAKYGIMFLHENGTFRAGALCGVPPALAEERRRNPAGLRPPPNTGVGIVLRTKKTVHIADILAEPQYFDVPAGFTRPAIIQFGGARTELAVPMLKEGELVGVIVIYRTEARPFSDKQIELVTNFAAQAVIAIENTRLLNELRKSLQQQTATADVLKVISRSTFDLQVVLDTLS